MKEIASGSDSEPRSATEAAAKVPARPRRMIRFTLDGRWTRALIGVLLLALYLLLLGWRRAPNTTARWCSCRC